VTDTSFYALGLT